MKLESLALMFAAVSLLAACGVQKTTEPLTRMENQTNPNANADPSSLAYIDHWIDIQARSGFADPDAVFENLEEVVEDEGLQYYSRLRTKLEDALKKQKEREADFPEITANDRLTQAFNQMNRQGLIAGENLGYTQSDGWDDLNQYFYEDGETAKGGVFYHGQDVERGITGAGLNIRFGAFGKNEDDAEIGRKVVKILKQHGFDPIWNEDPDMVIDLPPFQWQRRNSYGF